MAKLIRNPTPSELDAAAKAGRPMVLLPAEGEVVTVDRVQMLPGGARRKVQAGSWNVRRLGGPKGDDAPTMFLEAVTRAGLIRQAKARRSWTQRLHLVVALSAGVGLIVGAVWGSLYMWWVLG